MFCARSHTYTADTAYCKNKETGKWHNFDDSHVSETTDDHVMVSLVPQSMSFKIGRADNYTTTSDWCVNLSNISSSETQGHMMCDMLTLVSPLADFSGLCAVLPSTDGGPPHATHPGPLPQSVLC